MAERYDLKIARTDRNGKTWWTKIGVMFPMKERDGFNISLEALPIQTLNDDGRLECRITAWEPYKEGSNGGQQPLANKATAPPPPPSPTTGTSETELDDEIPW